jgi:uncharacterized protein
MTHATRFAAVAVLVPLVVLNVSCEAQTSESDALRVRAEAGDAEAQFLLGKMHDTGEGLPLGHADDAEAMRLLLQAAGQGYAAAQFYLGFKYQTGLGVPEDDAEAVRLYRLAADQGYAFAQERLGSMYSIGAGVPQDYVQAHMWLSLAASRWNNAPQPMTLMSRDWVVGDRNILEDRLTPDGLYEAQRLALEWELAHLREP